MITKLSLFSPENDTGRVVLPLFGKADAYFEKHAAASLLPEVSTYIAGLVPAASSQYVLVNALGASEYYGSNVNGDAFPEAALIHRPDNWANNPVIDSVTAKTWPYGFPTFYRAHPFAHHRNKDPNLAFGEVELACWNPHMKRVELVTRLDHDKCQKFGGTGVWDKLKSGGFPDVSMGSRVPFDTCSICLDKKRYKAALATFDPKRHRHPGQAVLEEHKKNPIRGVSITRKDYCDHCLKGMNRILPDGRKVFVDNDFPDFFDISFVFIGADRTAKTMLYIASGSAPLQAPAAAAASGGEENAKTASEERFFDQLKQGEIDKERVNNLPSKAVPLLTQAENDIPTATLNGLSALPLANVLSTLGGLGVVLRPREFQRVVLVSIGKQDLADDLDEAGCVFPRVGECSPLSLGPSNFLSALLPLLVSLLSMRSGFGPIVEPRAVILATPPGANSKPAEKKKKTEESEVLKKVSSLYNGYRSSLMDFIPHAQDLLSGSGFADTRLQKIAQAPVEDVFTPFAAHYFKLAFLDEVGDSVHGVIQR